MANTFSDLLPDWPAHLSQEINARNQRISRRMTSTPPAGDEHSKLTHFEAFDQQISRGRHTHLSLETQHISRPMANAFQAHFSPKTHHISRPMANAFQAHFSLETHHISRPMANAFQAHFSLETQHISRWRRITFQGLWPTHVKHIPHRRHTHLSLETHHISRPVANVF